MPFPIGCGAKALWPDLSPSNGNGKKKHEMQRAKRIRMEIVVCFSHVSFSFSLSLRLFHHHLLLSEPPITMFCVDFLFNFYESQTFELLG